MIFFTQTRNYELYVMSMCYNVMLVITPSYIYTPQKLVCSTDKTKTFIRLHANSVSL